MNILPSLVTLFTLARADVASEAKTSVTNVCSGVASYNTSVIYQSDKGMLEAFSDGNNAFTSMLIHPGCFSDITTCMATYQSGLIAMSVNVLFPAVIAVIMILLWIFIFAPCACCRCCRRSPLFCCLKEPKYPAGNYSRKDKMLFLAWSIMCIGGFILTATFAIVASQDITNGVNAAYCQVYQFVNNLVNGYSSGSHVWVGLIPMANGLVSIVDNLVTNSTFMVRVNTELVGSQDLTRAVTAFNSALSLMKSLIAVNANIPGTNFASPLATAGISSAVDSITAALNGGLAGSLNTFRTTVQSQLSGSQLTSTHANLFAAVSPLSGFSSVVEGTIGTLFISNRDTGVTAMETIEQIILGVSICFIVPAVFMLMTVFMGVFLSDRKTYRGTTLFPQNPLHASTAWCFTCFYTLIILNVSGALLVLIFSFSSTCHIMKNVGTYVAPLIEVSGGSSNTSQLTAMMNACIVSNASGNLQDALVVNGKTLRQTLEVVTSTSTAFSAMQSLVSAGATSSLATSTALISLMTVVDNWAGVYLINSMTSLKSTSGYSSSSGNAADLYTLLAQMTPECTPVSSSPSTTGLSTVSPTASLPTTVKGVSDFMTLLDTKTVLSFSGGSGGLNPTCAGGSQSTGVFDSAGSAGGSGDAAIFYNWGLLAQNARKYSGFRCDTLTNDGGTPLSTGTGTIVAFTGSSQASCVGTSGKSNFGAWLDHLRKFQAGGAYDIMALARAVDLAATASQSTISNNLGAAVTSYFTTPIATLQSQLDCSFISYNFYSIVDALCYGALPGLMGTTMSWVAMALLCIVVILIEFSIWRRLRDNYSLWFDSRTGLRGESAII